MSNDACLHRRRRARPVAAALAFGAALQMLMAAPRPAVASAGLKPVIRGVIDSHALALTQPALRPLVDAVVVTTGWSALQPQPGPVVRGNAIDQAITTVRAVKAAGGPSLRLKLRVHAGIDAPEWVKRLGGSPVPVEYEGRTGTVGRFWAPQLAGAYLDLQRQLAALYDDVPEVAEVVISRCTTFYAEPFLRQWGNTATQRALLAAGYTADADAACHRGQVDAHTVWRTTRSGLALNPYQRIEASGRVRPDIAFTRTMMQYCRSVLGARCVLENNSIRFPQQDGQGYAEMYAAMQGAGAPLAFQTAMPTKIGDWVRTLWWAASVGASSVEVNRSYPTYDRAQLALARARLQGSLPA